MKKSRRKEIGIKKLKRAGKTYVQIGNQIREFKKFRDIYKSPVKVKAGKDILEVPIAPNSESGYVTVSTRKFYWWEKLWTIIYLWIQNAIHKRKNK